MTLRTDLYMSTRLENIYMYIYNSNMPASTCILSLFLPRKGIVWCGVRTVDLDGRETKEVIKIHNQYNYKKIGFSEVFSTKFDDEVI